MKGISPLIAAVFLVIMTVVASTLLSGWLSSTATFESGRIRNSTIIQLQCQYADLYIKNATYNCGLNCTTGTQHTTQVTVVNSGKKSINIDRLHIRNTTGIVTSLLLNETKTVSVGDALTITNTTRATCTGINNSIEVISVSSIECPANAYDSLDSKDLVYVSC
ncbi:MAG: hypothetical protein HY517_01505 [Candidatus Aenigmarchaeota archaeon]|nr:hypothetical protein [Candidatus Aenigmarchaeota archaeon]